MAVIGYIVTIGVLVLALLSGSFWRPEEAPNAIERLMQRYARGEIDRQTLERMLHDLIARQSSTSP